MLQVLDTAEDLGYNEFDELAIWCKILNNAKHVKKK